MNVCFFWGGRGIRGRGPGGDLTPEESARISTNDDELGSLCSKAVIAAPLKRAGYQRIGFPISLT